MQKHSSEHNKIQSIEERWVQNSEIIYDTKLYEVLEDKVSRQSYAISKEPVQTRRYNTDEVTEPIYVN